MPLLLPIDAGLDALPGVALTDDEIAAIARGQFVRPAAGLPAAGRRTTGSRTRRARSWRSPTRAAAALAPDKVLVAPGADRRRAPIGRAPMHVVTASTP